MQANEEIKNAWAKFHMQGDIGPLTGTSFEHMVSLYDLKDVLAKGMNVLEIGVGFGFCIKGLFETGCNVYAMDICDGAFECVKNYIQGSFLHERAWELPDDYFDLALSHLVTQHMSETDIISQFPNVIRSLKSGGFFCVQFAYSDIPEENNISETIVGTPADGKVSMLGGRMVRTPDYAENLINRCGGRVIFTSEMIRWPKFKSGWYLMRVVKA